MRSLYLALQADYNGVSTSSLVQNLVENFWNFDLNLFIFEVNAYLENYEYL